MKLWQKIFLSSLFIVMFSVCTIGILLLKKDFNTTLENQKQNTISTHHYMVSNINNRVITKRMQSNAILLSTKDIISVLEEIFQNSDDSSLIVALINDYNETVYNNETLKISQEFFDTITSESTTCTQIVTSKETNRLIVASPISIEKQDYVFVTSTDISDIYDTYHNQFEYIKKLCIFFSLAGAILLVIILKILLRPLAILNDATRVIANGDYSKRISIDSYDELGELSANMNIMADSIEKNVTLLENIAENRNQFINNFTHEMKTPLTSILGFSDILRIKRNLTNEEVSEYSEIIFNEASRLKALSGKLMELISLGETSTDFSKIHTKELFTSITQVLSPIVKTNNLNLICYCDDCIIDADKELLRSMIYNFSDNAIKASPEGSTVTLNGSFENNLFTITVKDEGIGIAKEELDKITEPFYMVDKARTRKAGGAGLGLALCKKIAELHNAEFTIDSVPNKGTTITVIMKGESAYESDIEETD